jgi:predicted GH43/DUF377 family glycosyl hydrolase
MTTSGGVYRLGLALLDVEDPRKMLLRSDDWVFAPAEVYEREGDVHDVVFPCGWIAQDDDLRLYYGAADTSIAVTTAKVSEVLRWLHQHSQVSA